MSEVINTIGTVQLEFFFIVGLGLLNIALALKCKVPLINFVVGIFTLGMTALSIGTEMPFDGYVQLFAILMALISMLIAVYQWRSWGNL